MRPLYLSIKGINSFIDKQEINFADLKTDNIFCIYGPTGAGKSTILDSIILALYGSAGSNSKLSDFVNLSCDKGEIVFRFEKDDINYEVTRTITKKSTSKVVLKNLSNNSILENALSEISDNIVGLDKDEFSQVIALEQGNFAKFFDAKPSERKKTVAKLFGLNKYSNLQKKFNDRATALENAMNIVKARNEHLQDATKDNLKLKTDTLKTIETERKDIEKNLIQEQKKLNDMMSNKKMFDSLEQLKQDLLKYENELKQIQESEDKIKQSQKLIEDNVKEYDNQKNINKRAEEFLLKLDSFKDSILRTKELEKLILEKRKDYAEKAKKLDEFKKIIEESNKKHLQLSEQISKNIKELNAILSNELDRDDENLNNKLVELNSNFKIIAKNVEEKQKNIEEYKKNIEEYKKKTEENPKLIEKKSKELEQLEKELLRLEQEKTMAYNNNASIGIISNLKDGDKCPVCGGIFSNEHIIIDAKLLDITKIDEQIASKKILISQNNNDKIVLIKNQEQDLKNLQVTVENLTKAEKELVNDLKIFKKYNDNIFNDSQQIVKNLITYIKDNNAIEKSLQELVSNQNEYNLNINLIKEQGISFKQEQDNLNQSILKNLGENYIERKEKEEKNKKDSNIFIINYDKQKEENQKQSNDIKVQKASKVVEITKTKEQIVKVGDIVFDENGYKNLEESLKQYSIKKEENLKQSANLEKEIKDITSNIEVRKKNDAEILQIQKNHDLADMLYKLTRADKFLTYVSEKYIYSFTEYASEKLSDLSSGKYTLEYEDENFYVKDFLRGGEKRKVNTLSGGETFLASVSMAIGISELIAKNKAFDFFFLDEGFGTLDSNSIDTVSDALQTLATNTLVGVISHRSELVEKIPTRLKIIPSTEDVGSKIVLEKM